MTTQRPVRFLDRTSPPTIATLIVMASMNAAAMNMFVPSLPAMTAYFGTEYRVMQLTVALFLAANAVLQLAIGPFSDRYGRRPVLLVGTAIFILATLGCIFAPTAETLLTFRVLQAAIVVNMVLSRSIIRDLYDQNKAASMIGYVTMGMAVVPMITPAIGGWLDEHFGWQANFWALAGLGLLVLALIWLDTGETNKSMSTSFRAQVREYPELFRSLRFWGYSLAAAFSSGAFFAYVGGAPFVGSNVFGMSPSVLGLFFGAPALGYILGNGLTGRLASRVGINLLILYGAAIAAFGCALSLSIALAGLASPASFFGLMTFVGVGNGLVLPNAIAGTLSVRPSLAGTASGLGGALMIGGGAFLSALAGSMLVEGSGPEPLLWIMSVVTLLGVAAILFVMHRERSLNIA